MRSQIRFAVWRCLRGALRSASRTASINDAAGSTFTCGRSVFFRCAGVALRTASRTMRRCTPNFRATPAIVPAPNSYSRRICSYSSTLALQSNSRHRPKLALSTDQEFALSNSWARTNGRSGPEQVAKRTATADCRRSSIWNTTSRCSTASLERCADRRRWRSGGRRAGGLRVMTASGSR